MENLEDKFLSLEIDDELQKLKQELGYEVAQASQDPTTSQNHQGYTSPRNERQDQPNTDKKARFYTILGLKPEASEKEVKQAYRNLVKRYHPDLFFKNPQLRQKAEEVIQKLNTAYEEVCSKF